MLTARRAVTVAAIVALLSGCTPSSSSAPVPSASASPNLALSKAADLRTHLDLLLGEHVMIVAKQSAAAINHADEYAAYASLLHANADDLSTLFTRALGATTAGELRDAWNQQNALLVDYAIGVATHDDAKSKQAAAALATSFAPMYAQLLASASGASAGRTSGLLTQQLAMDRAVVDDYAAQRYPAFYVDLERAYTTTTQLGDSLAAAIVRMYADKFPGDPSAPVVDSRVRLNMQLQDDAYLATMATDASVAARTAEAAAAQAALKVSATMLREAIAAAKGDDAGTRFSSPWTARNAAMSRYAAGDRSAGTTVTATTAVQVANATHAPSAAVTEQAIAMLKVVDDQLAKATVGVANDDRASATAMQPIADAIVS